jgi:hypothetical protein
LSICSSFISKLSFSIVTEGGRVNIRTFINALVLLLKIIILLSLFSPPPSLPGSQPHTREASPCPNFSSGNFNARTPPPKRWKRSFDMTQPMKDTTTSVEQPLPLVRSLIRFCWFSCIIFSALLNAVSNH